MRVSAFAALAALTLAAPAAAAEDYGLGKPVTAEDIAPWNIDVAPDGAGLPPGEGSVAAGKQIFADRCAACHGDHGQGGPMDRLAGGIGTLHDAKPVKTVGSFWPYASTLFDFVNRAMPYDAPQTLSADEVYSVCAYVLFLNGLLPAEAKLDKASLVAVKMPNRDGFVSAYPPKAPQ